MKSNGLGIVGLGSYLPPQVRENEFWPSSIFEDNGADDIGSADATLLAELKGSPFGRIALEEMAKWKDDPFHGAVERRVAPDDMPSSQMEVLAAKSALADAGLAAKDVGLLLLNSFLPDRPVPGNAGAVHRGLGLPVTTPAIGVDGVCGSFPLQMQLAAGYLLAGGARHALLVQSALQSRCLDHRRPLSTTFGDAATAVVLGPVPDGSGILSCVSFNDGRYNNVAVLASQPDEPWYTGQNRMLITTCDLPRTKEVIFRSGEMAATAMDRALEEAGISRSDIAFFTSHQTIAAFNAICRRCAGLDHVRYVDTFRQIASVSACAIPFNLEVGRREGLLRRGDVAAVFTTGAGFNWSAALMRWSL